jgi:hypothetical protein
MAHPKMSDEDEGFLRAPAHAKMLFAGVGGTETWIERDRDTVVHILIRSVATSAADNATLEACIAIGDGVAKGRDGPWTLGQPLRAAQAVEVIAKAGERLAFKAYPVAENAQVMRTAVWVLDFEPADAAATGPAKDEGDKAPDEQRAA